MRPLLLSAAALIALAGCSKAEPKVEDATIRLPIVPGRPGAAYFTLVGGAKPDRLLAIETDMAKTVELHESAMADGVMTMRKLDGVDLPAGGRVVFAPGGNHAMLFDISPVLKQGTKTTLRFRFGSGTVVPVEAETTATVAVGNSH
jgi:copper(I)-binding protein